MVLAAVSSYTYLHKYPVMEAYILFKYIPSLLSRGAYNNSEYNECI